MRSFRSTWLMATAAALLAGYTYWEFRKASAVDGDLEKQERKIFAFKPEEVSEVKITRSSDSVELKKVGDAWKMLRPVEDEADSTSVQSFLYSALSQKSKVFRSEEESRSTKWVDFGLEPAGTTIEITHPKASEKIEVSTKNAFDGSFYVRQGGELLLGDRGLAQMIARSSQSLRSRRLWRDPTLTVTAALAEFFDGRHKDQFKIVKQTDKWSLEPAPTFALDHEKVANWLVKVEELQADEIAGDSLSEDEKRNYLLTKPSARLTLHYKKPSGVEGDWILTFGQDRDQDTYLFHSDRATIYKVQNSALNTIRVPVTFFRDGKRGFQFPVESAHKVQLSYRGKGYVFVKEGTTWKISGDSGDMELNPDRLIKLVQTIHELEAHEFISNSSLAKGFKDDQVITIRDAQDQILLQLSWGDKFTSSRSFNKGMTFHLAKTNLEKEWMAVSSDKIAGLVDSQLLVKKAVKK